MTHERWCGWTFCTRQRCHGDRSRRAVKRGAKLQWGRHIANDIDDHIDERNEPPEYCGPYCGCGDDLYDELEQYLLPASIELRVDLGLLARVQ